MVCASCTCSLWPVCLFAGDYYLWYYLYAYRKCLLSALQEKHDNVSLYDVFPNAIHDLYVLPLICQNQSPCFRCTCSCCMMLILILLLKHITYWSMIVFQIPFQAIECSLGVENVGEYSSYHSVYNTRDMLLLQFPSVLHTL